MPVRHVAEQAAIPGNWFAEALRGARCEPQRKRIRFGPDQKLEWPAFRRG